MDAAVRKPRLSRGFKCSSGVRPVSCGAGRATKVHVFAGPVTRSFGRSTNRPSHDAHPGGVMAKSRPVAFDGGVPLALILAEIECRDGGSLCASSGHSPSDTGRRFCV
jgi:hypothetical protein